MWIDYFYQIQKKYTMRISDSKPLVIRLDGKDVTKDPDINFLYSHKGSFLYCLKEAAKYFSKKYECYALCGTDEISFIVENPKKLFEDIQSDQAYYSQEIISVFAEYFYDYFNTLYKPRKIFWHAKCYSISKEKFKSYITYRKKSIQNVIVTYFLKKNNIRNVGNEKISTRLEMCKNFSERPLLEKEMFGNLFFNGNQIDMNEFFNGNIKIIDENNNQHNDNNNNTNNSINDDFDIDIDIEF